jgi:hypothetical protein
MTAKQKTVTGLVILVLVFLLGFVPQYLEKRQIQSEFAISSEKLKMSELRAFDRALSLLDLKPYSPADIRSPNQLRSLPDRRLRWTSIAVPSWTSNIGGADKAANLDPHRQGGKQNCLLSSSA